MSLDNPTVDAARPDTLSWAFRHCPDRYSGFLADSEPAFGETPRPQLRPLIEPAVPRTTSTRPGWLPPTAWAASGLAPSWTLHHPGRAPLPSLQPEELSGTPVDRLWPGYLQRRRRSVDMPGIARTFLSDRRGVSVCFANIQCGIQPATTTGFFSPRHVSFAIMLLPDSNHQSEVEAIIVA